MDTHLITLLLKQRTNIMTEKVKKNDGKHLSCYDLRFIGLIENIEYTYLVIATPPG